MDKDNNWQFTVNIATDTQLSSWLRQTWGCTILAWTHLLLWAGWTFAKHQLVLTGSTHTALIKTRVVTSSSTCTTDPARAWAQIWVLSGEACVFIRTIAMSATWKQARWARSWRRRWCTTTTTSWCTTHQRYSVCQTGVFRVFIACKSTWLKALWTE